MIPPAVLILLALAGLVLIRLRPRLGHFTVAVSIVALYALSIPAVSRPLLRSLEPPYSGDPAREAAGAIVVLGGGSYLQAPEYGRDTVSSATLARIRYGARLHRATGKPILVTGGNPTGRAAMSEGAQMNEALGELGADARWVEEESRNTFENARFSARILQAVGIDRVYLVTHAWHMPRARLAFEQFGLRVVPAATAYKATGPIGVGDFLPSMPALLDSSHFFHEVIGGLWYRLKFRLDETAPRSSS